MMLTGWQRVTVLGLVLGFIAVVAIGFLAFVSDANQTNVGHWFDRNGTTIAKAAVAIIPAALTYLLGRGRRPKGGHEGHLLIGNRYCVRP